MTDCNSQALKNMVVQRNKEEKTKSVMQRVEAVSLTADMWASINMTAYLAVTCHYVDKAGHSTFGSAACP